MYGLVAYTRKEKTKRARVYGRNIARGLYMVRYSYNLAQVNADAARAIVGKKLEHIITVVEKLQYSTEFFNVEIFVSSDGSKNITISSCNTYDDNCQKYRVEKLIHVNSGKGGAIASARQDYFSGAGRENTSTRYMYLDWIVPGAKKLEQIINKTF